MLLSALILAALLQAAPSAPPAAPLVVIPEAAPVVGLKGYQLQRRPYVMGQSVDQKRAPFRKKAGASKKPVVKPLLAANCGPKPEQQAAFPEKLSAQPLATLPKAHGERAVARLVDGCPVSVLIAQNDPLH